MNFKGIEIRCPHCKGDLSSSKEPGDCLRCGSCGRSFPVILGIPDLRVFPDPYIDMEADRAKGLQVASRLEDLNFSELVDFYYTITSVVPPRHARQYKRGLMAGAARAESALRAWEKAVGANGRLTAGSLLDVGCGTGPLLVAAAPLYRRLVGVDIAFRWLVVAKKRLAEAGFDIPLFCACAEALPFPDGAFHRVAADSVLEHVQDQRKALAECYRVARPGSYLFVSTPNRFNLGPDPHIGLWGGAFLPERLLNAYVRWQGGIPPKRRLLSLWSLAELIREAGFCSPRILLPDVPAGQRRHFGKGMKMLVDLYHIAKRLPGSPHVLSWIGPLLQAAAEKRNPLSHDKTN